jgi:putative polyketide hydroxylase
VGSTLGDPDGRFAEAFGLSPSGAVIVRPDGHVAWRAVGDIAASPDTVQRVMSALLCR